MPCQTIKRIGISRMARINFNKSIRSTARHGIEIRNSMPNFWSGIYFSHLNCCGCREYATAHKLQRFESNNVLVNGIYYCKCTIPSQCVINQNHSTMTIWSLYLLLLCAYRWRWKPISCPNVNDIFYFLRWNDR